MSGRAAAIIMLLQCVCIVDPGPCYNAWSRRDGDDTNRLACPTGQELVTIDEGYQCIESADCSCNSEYCNFPFRDNTDEGHLALMSHALVECSEGMGQICAESRMPTAVINATYQYHGTKSILVTGARSFAHDIWDSTLDSTVCKKGSELSRLQDCASLTGPEELCMLTKKCQQPAECVCQLTPHWTVHDLLLPGAVAIVTEWSHKVVMAKVEKPTGTNLEPLDIKITCQGRSVHITANSELASIKITSAEGEKDVQMHSDYALIELSRSYWAVGGVIVVVAFDAKGRMAMDSVVCKRKNNCEDIECIVCIEHLCNFACYPRTAFLTCLLAAWSFGITIRVLAQYCYLATQLLAACWKGKSTISLVKMLMEDIPDGLPYHFGAGPKITRRLKKGRTATAMIIGFILLYLMGQSMACTEVATMSVNTDACTRNGETITCQTKGQSAVTLPPVGEKTCLLLTGDKGLLGTAELEMVSMDYTCIPSIMYYSKPWKAELMTAIKCFWTTNCTRSFCLKIGDVGRIDAFSKDSQDLPGYQTCTEGTTIGWAYGCGSAATVCGFHRVYARNELDSSWFMAGQCASWTPTATVRLTIPGPEGPDRYLLKLQLSATNRFTGGSAVLTSLVTNIYPTMSSTWIKELDTGKAAVRSVSAKATAIFGMPGGVQCGQPTEFSSTNCVFHRSSCMETPAAEELAVECTDETTDSLYSEDVRLPRMINGQLYRINDDGQLTVKIEDASVVTMHLIWDNVVVKPLSRAATCIARKATVEGCAACVGGAIMKMECRASEPAVVAYVKCATFSAFIPCSPDGAMATTRIFTGATHIDTTCDVICGSSELTVSVSGELVLERVRDLTNVRAARAFLSGHSEHGFKLPSFGLSWAFGLSLTLIIAVAAVVAGIMFAPIWINLVQMWAAATWAALKAKTA